MTGIEPADVPEELRERDHWVLWREETPPDRDDKTKVPYKVQPLPFDEHRASSREPDGWASFSSALTAFREHRETHGFDGLGFMFDPDDVLVGVDLDKCRDPETGDIDEWAQKIVDDLDSWTEISVSGTGLHVFTIGVKPGDNARTGVDPDDPVYPDEQSQIEMYDKWRYFAVTGDHLEGTPTSIKQAAEGVRNVYDQYLADDDTGGGDDDQEDVDLGPSDLDDDELLEKARNAENGTAFERLYDRGDYSGYPSQSEADLALCSYLAFWTGGDERRMDSLFRNSGLMRDKWEEDRGAMTYGERTIQKALSGQQDFYDPGEGNDSSPPPDRSDGGDGDDDAGVRTSPSRSPAWEDIYHDYALSAEQNTDVERRDARYESVKELLRCHAYAADETTDVLYLYDDETGIYRDRGEEHIHNQLAEHLGKFYTRHEKVEVVSAIRGRTYRMQDEFGGPEWHINVANGVLDLESVLDGGDPDLRDHRADDLYRAGSPVEFDADAACPTWKEFLSDVTVGESDRLKLQEFAGYCLMHWDYPYHKALFIVGPGASGKSTYLDAIRGILGREAVASITPQELIEERFAGVELHGAWANIRNDIPDAMIKNTGKFKEIVAGDPIKVEEKHQPTFTIEPTAKHLYSTNQLPEAAVDDDAFYRRILLTAFPTTVPRDERDPTLPEKLESEYPGILNWAIEGLGRLIEQGKFTGDEPPEQTRQTWESWGSSIEKFKQDVLEYDESSYLPKSEAYSAYVAWCRENGLPAITQQKMTRRLKNDPKIEDTRKSIKGKQKRCYVGVELLDQRVPDDDDDDPDRTGLGDY